MNGCFNTHFRTGGSRRTVTETILRSLNEARGTAFAPEPGTLVYKENYALACVLSDAWKTARRFSYQFDPAHMSTFIERWEAILGIVPGQTDTLADRRTAIGAVFALESKPALGQTVTDFLSTILGDLFVSVMHVDSNQALMRVPGGATVTGGGTVANGAWISWVNHLLIRLRQPDYVSDDRYIDRTGTFQLFLDNFLPAWVSFRWMEFARTPGTISVTAGSNAVVGVSTTFATGNGKPLLAGDLMEVVTNAGELVTLTIASVADNTHLTLVSVSATAITAKPWRRLGFFLDQPNLDRCVLNA